MVEFMHKKIHILFVFFALFSLSLIGYDYVCGHFGENPFISNHCLLCKAFQSTELVNDFPILQLFFGLLLFIDLIRNNKSVLPKDISLTVVSLRAPPETPQSL